MGTILVVDDDPVERRVTEAALLAQGHRVRTSDDGEDALTKLAQQSFDCVLLDLVMPGLDGMGVLERMDHTSGPPVVVQTAKGSIDAVVSAMRAGASDFVVKPASAERLKVSIGNACRSRSMARTVRHVERERHGILDLDDIVAGPEMKDTLTLSKRAAASSIPVLLEGETGTGKEVLARAIHGASERAGRPFVAVNCGALPDNLVESILFGHEKGAFTGAVHSAKGKFQQAQGGTLFLDEVGELEPHVQVKLLRALQEGEVDPVGAAKPVPVDVRIISATNRNMIDLVTLGEFREDLYYRLHVFPVAVPPLRRRRGDVEPLARHFLSRFAIEEGRRIAEFSPAALDALASHDWPGNVRQLENTIFRAVVLCDGERIELSDLPQIARAEGLASHEEARPRAPAPAVPGPRESVAAPSIQPPDPVPYLGTDGRLRALEDVEADMIRFALDHHDGRMTLVARSLGIGRSTLYRRLKELGLDGDTIRDRTRASG